jgi:crotonobetainyl-CoA:carnitine CoA-transferase CaiB-like acyl-CoA transferase
MQPFADVDVLDLTQSIAGPVCTQMLALLGANVVKIEPPGGDAFREVLGGSMFAAFNHGPKRSLGVDLKSEAGAETVRDLAGRADVVVESFRPGVLERFDLDYDSVAATNETVVYCSLTGFGREGPYRDYPAYDPVIQATSGLMSVVGYPDRPPARIGASVIDSATGANAAFMISAALHEVDRTGTGEHVDISLFDVAVSWMSYWIANYSATDEVPTRAGSGFDGLAPNDVYHAAGDEPFYLCVVDDRRYERLCRAIDREDLLDDERFADNDARWTHREALRESLESTFREYDRSALVERLAENGVPAGPLEDVPGLLADDHVAARDLLSRARNPTAGTDVTVSRLPIRTADWIPDPGERPPGVGEHTREVLHEFGYDDAEIEALRERGAVFRAADEPRSTD